MLRSSLFLKSFTWITAGVVVMCAIFYLTTVPMINSMAYEMEEKAGRTILNNIYLLIKQSHAHLESWEKTAKEGHKRELKHLVDMAASLIQAYDAKGRKAGSDAALLDLIRHLRYGQHQDYIWVSDYKSRLIAHPDPALNGKDFSHVKDVKGNLIVPPMVQGAIARGEGYYSYWWRRLGQDEPIEKLSYYRNIPSKGWVIGTGVYIDDIRREVEARKRELLSELRRLVHSTKFAGEGYFFIFDSHRNMIIHPNSNIEGTNFAKLPDPTTGKPIADELIHAAGTPGGKLNYMWDKPADPGRYIYKKIGWVKYFKPFDWYIALSVYNDDLERSAAVLTRRIVLISLAALLLALAGGYLFVRAFTTPIARMAESAKKISSGDLSSTIELRRKDEIGLLAQAFNNMVIQLREQIRNLEERVKERTLELSNHLHVLKERNKEIETLNSMGDILQACRNQEEVVSITIHTIQKLFPSSSGHIMNLDRSSNSLEISACWGGEEDDGKVFSSEDCWSIRRGKTHFVQGKDRLMLCPHAHPSEDGAGAAHICIPMSAQGEIFGVLHARIPLDAVKEEDSEGEERRRNAIRMLETVAEHAALSVSNIRLQQRLHEQSTRDPLTGLYNRRFTEEAIQKEQKRADRAGDAIGIMLMDIDHFKRINDTWGHDAGDEVLKRLASILRGFFRSHDIVCRYGGEEFLVIMPGADLETAAEKAGALRATVEERLRIPWKGDHIAATVSIGVSQYPWEGHSFQQLIDLADKALYRAKEQGRNRVVKGFEL